MMNKPDVRQKLTEGSEAIQLLRAMFDRCDITTKSGTKSAYEFNSTLHKNHRLDPFRTRLNNMKKEFRTNDCTSLRRFSTL